MGISTPAFLLVALHMVCVFGAAADGTPSGIAGITEEQLLAAVLEEDCFGNHCDGNGVALSLLQHHVDYIKPSKADQEANTAEAAKASKVSGVTEEQLLAAVLEEDCIGNHCDGNGVSLSRLQQKAYYTRPKKANKEANAAQAAKQSKLSASPQRPATSAMNKDLTDQVLRSGDTTCQGLNCGISLLQLRAGHVSKNSESHHGERVTTSVNADGSLGMTQTNARSTSSATYVPVRAESKVRRV